MAQGPYQAVAPVRYSPGDLTRAWADWQAAYVTAHDSGPEPRRQVVIETDRTTTYSEGQAYGLLLAAQFDDQALFDGLWLYAADHLNANGLMAWITTGQGQVLNWGAATDAEMDMALALIMACRKVERGEWAASLFGLDYCALAQNLLAAMWAYEVDHPGPGPAAGLDDNPGYELLPGDMWCLACDFPDGIVNLSYFAPGYLRVFANFTGNMGWLDVLDRMYAIAGLAQDQGCSGLVPNWNTYAGVPQHVDWQADTAELWAWDAARFAWRIAVDRQWYDSPQSHPVLNRLGSFFGSVGISNIQAIYALDGTPVVSFHNVYFTGSGAVAVWAAPAPRSLICGQADGGLQSTAQQGYDAVRAAKNETYFSDTWRLLYMLLMTGQFAHPEQAGAALADGAPATGPQAAPPSAVPTASAPVSAGGNGSLLLEIRRDGPDDARQAQFRLRLTNRGGAALSGVTLRFYFTPDAGLPPARYVLENYWDSSGAAALAGPFGDGAQAFFTLSYGAASLPPGAAWEFTGGLHLDDWQPRLDTANDWWKTGLGDTLAPTQSIPVYVQDRLVLGQRP